jgi:hypothetical protein
MCNLVKVLSCQKLELKLKDLFTGFSTREVEKNLEAGNWKLEFAFGIVKFAQEREFLNFQTQLQIPISKVQIVNHQSPSSHWATIS